MDPAAGLFTVLTLIAAPAVLTNASSVLALNTANRFGRVVDRSRVLANEMMQVETGSEGYEFRQRQLDRLHARAQMLMSVQSALYAALGSFVATALLAVTGALSGSALGIPALAVGLGLGALLVGSVATGCLFYACTMLVRETRLALMGMREDVTPFGHILPSPGAPK